MGDIYLLHGTEPVGNENHSARHYIGYTERDVEVRIQEHVDGVGSPLVWHLARAGEVLLARLWRNKSRHFERRLKNQKNHGRMCPHCNPNWERHFT